MIEIATTEAMKQTDPYLEQFERWIEPSAGQHPAWLYPLRKAGLARFAELGFPTLRDEDWRFTNIAPIAKMPFKPECAWIKSSVARKLGSRSPLPGNVATISILAPPLVLCVSMTSRKPLVRSITDSMTG